MARAALMSSAHFSRRFREAYRETPYGYLQTGRVERAMALLRRGDVSVTEACFEVGFTSREHTTNEDQVSSRKEAVRTYFDGFRESDHGKSLALLTDDVVWDLYGHRHLRGKHEFDGEIENGEFEGSPKLTVDRLIEDEETVVVPHHGEARRSDGGVLRFAAVDVFTFDGDLISRVESYVVPVQA